MASSRVMASSSPSHTTSDLARFAAGRGGSTGLGSMNVEEILRGIYADMPTPSLAPVVDGGRPMSPPPAPGIAAAAAAPRTAEEVWKEITGGVGVAAAAPDVVAAGGGGGAGGGAGAAEMTLEDFLAREGGAVKEDVVAGPSASAVEGQVVMGFLNGAEVAGGVTGGGRSRKRQLMDPMDRAAMQRQKRMIKNRESAARSRERKQAYIAELESLVMQLEEENAKMFKEQEEQHQKRLKELKEMITPVVVRKMPSRDLRRTNSMQWCS
uniref:BZIP domain-containing protein n=2 Tax=Leersia perrieri TaxID=77586 RepID=A0A0D9V876_9ORYZ